MPGFGTSGGINASCLSNDRSFAEIRFAIQPTQREGVSASPRRGSRVDEPGAYLTEDMRCLAPDSRFDDLLTLPEAADIDARVNAAMREIEKRNPQRAAPIHRMEIERK